MNTVQVLLPGDARSAGRARGFLAETLAKWGARQYWDAAAILVSELVANAALHARSEITMCLTLDPSFLRVEVSDRSRLLPVERHYGVQAATGRGLMIVAALARDWGVEVHPEGKTVWARLEDDPPGSPGASGPSGGGVAR
ncbi:MAG TPA: ATP-binding protein [Acidimicrobiales bacterium]|nr:ATP-binding protein [Acidimicrobiales bacterium]